MQIPIEPTIDEETGEVVEPTTTIDPAYLVMTDDDITLFIKLGISRAYPNITDIAELPSGSEYPITLLAKIELYLKLAVLKADKVDMGADNNNYLKQNQRFQHYMALVEEAREQYTSWLDNEGQGEVSSYDVLLSKRHYTQRNFEKQVTPKVSLKIDQVTSDSVDFHWGVSNTSHFGRFKVYISESPVIDMFRDGATYDKKLNEDAKLIVSTQNIRNTYHRVGNLESDKTYYIAVVSIERNQVFGYAELSFNTLAELEDEEEIFNDSLEEEVIPPTDNGDSDTDETPDPDIQEGTEDTPTTDEEGTDDEVSNEGDLSDTTETV